MNLCVIGLGSIAARHIKNIKELFGGDVTIDVLRSGAGKPIAPELGSLIENVCVNERQLSDRYDAIFITNPTALHYETLLQYHERSDSFFVEKPAFTAGDEDLSPFARSDKKYYVACPLRYTNVIQYLKKNVDFFKVRALRCISSSYLPDWRPGTDYRKTYSAHKDMGGGVSIDLIHEWDYIQYLIGYPDSLSSIIAKKSALEIDSDDTAIYIAEYADKVAEVHLDYYGRAPVRRLELITDEDTIVADLIVQRIEWLRAGNKLDLAQDRNDYQKREMLHFFDIVKGGCESDNPLSDACKTLRLTRGMT